MKHDKLCETILVPGFGQFSCNCVLRAEVERLRERCYPSKVVEIGDTGHYVSEAAYAEIKSLRSRLALLEGDYQRIIREVLACDPLPASSRPDDQLEPPWEVIARLRSRLAAAEATIDLAARALRGEGMEDQHMAWNTASTILDAHLAGEGGET